MGELPIGHLANAELLRVMLDTAPVTVWGIDLAGTIIFAEGRHRLMEGRSHIGSSLPQLVGGRDSAVWTHHQRALDGETHHAHVDFGGVSFDAIYMPLRDDDQRVVGAVGMATDITDQLATAADLRKTEALNALIIDTIPGGVVFVAPDGSIYQANETACAVLGLSLDELTGRYVNDFASATIFEDGSPCPVSSYPVTRCLQTREPQTPMTIGVRRGEEVRWAVFSAVPAHHPDTSEFLGAIVTFLETTEQRAADEQRRRLEEQLARSQRLESVGRLAGGIAHDFNNLLVAILGHADLLREQLDPSSEQHESAATIVHAATRAGRLTEQLLGFARRGKIKQEPVDLDERVTTVRKLLERTIDKRIRMHHEPLEGGAWVEGDPGQIEQVLLNLALNARDSMVDGGVLSFETFTTTPGPLADRQSGDLTGPTVGVIVRDTGAGIAQADESHVFEPFFTTKALGKGSGMGLAVAYGIARNHGGWLRLESTSDSGTAFVLELPRIELEALAAKAGARPEEPPGGAHILLVDDEPVVRDITTRHLLRLGHTVTFAVDGHGALEKFKREPSAYDLVLLDLMMPKMRGDECFDRMLAIDPTVRAVLCTGFGEDGAASDAQARGIVGYLAKPYTLEELRRAISSALSDRPG